VSGVLGLLIASGIRAYEPSRTGRNRIRPKMKNEFSLFAKQIWFDNNY